MNELAQELNETLAGTAAGSLLSELGKRIFFPKGIVAQTAEAKQHAHRLNATVGMAYTGKQPVHLSAIRELVPGLAPEDIFTYVTTSGDPVLRDLWKREMIRKNSRLEGKTFSLPQVVSGITHGIATIADLFVDASDTVILPDLFWGNYRLIFETRKEARIAAFPFFDDSNALNTEGLRNLLEEQKGRCLVLLNFPNNPTGYSPSDDEAEEFKRILVEAAETGLKFAVVSDDAYFGLFYETGTHTQSLFASLADAHPNILAVKIDGATKEDYAWGFRLGFLTFASPGMTDSHFQALEKKVMGAIRSSISNGSRIGQSLLIRGLQSSSYQQDKAEAFRLMKAKYTRVKQILDRNTVPSCLSVLPFNSGYFMCFKLDRSRLDAESLRQHLLHNEAVGTISISPDYLRIAYSMLDEEELDSLYTAIFKAAEKLSA